MKDRYARSAVVNDQWWQGAGRKLAKDRLRNRGDLGIRRSQIGIGLQEDFDHSLAVYGCGFDVFNVVDGGGQNAFVDAGQPAFHFLRVEARVLPGDGDHRNIDVREDVGRRAQDHDRANNENKQRQHDEGVGAIECDLNNPHAGTSRLDRAPIRHWRALQSPDGHESQTIVFVPYSCLLSCSSNVETVYDVLHIGSADDHLNAFLQNLLQHFFSFTIDQDDVFQIHDTPSSLTRILCFRPFTPEV